MLIRAALIVAGGYGKRMGSSVPKQYLEIGGIPILARTIFAFESHPLVDRIVVTVPAGHEEMCETTIVQQFKLTKVAAVTEGGLERQQSVYNGLKKLGDTDLVAIHDGARPLVSHVTITRTFEVAEATGACLACSPVQETVKRQDGDHLLTIPRENLWLAHTPQTFRTHLIMEAHEAARKDGFLGTDDALLVERLGYAVSIVEDDRNNIKITTPGDLRLAECLLLSKVPFPKDNDCRPKQFQDSE